MEKINSGKLVKIEEDIFNLITELLLFKGSKLFQKVDTVYFFKIFNPLINLKVFYKYFNKELINTKQNDLLNVYERWKDTYEQYFILLCEIIPLIIYDEIFIMKTKIYEIIKKKIEIISILFSEYKLNDHPKLSESLEKLSNYLKNEISNSISRGALLEEGFYTIMSSKDKKCLDYDNNIILSEYDSSKSSQIWEYKNNLLLNYSNGNVLFINHGNLKPKSKLTLWEYKNIFDFHKWDILENGVILSELNNLFLTFENLDVFVDNQKTNFENQKWNIIKLNGIKDKKWISLLNIFNEKSMKLLDYKNIISCNIDYLVIRSFESENILNYVLISYPTFTNMVSLVEKFLMYDKTGIIIEKILNKISVYDFQIIKDLIIKKINQDQFKTYSYYPNILKKIEKIEKLSKFNFTFRVNKIFSFEDFMKIPDIEIAKQLTVLVQESFNYISLMDLTKYEINAQNKTEHSPVIKYLKILNNWIEKFIVNSIILTRNIQ